MPPVNRRKLIRAAFLAGAGAFAYGALIERRYPFIERVTCPVPDRHEALDGLTIAVMSDFHHDEFHDDSLMGRAIRATNALNPDVIMLTGDFITRALIGLEALADHFSGLRAKLGVFAVLGNHDQWTSSELIARRIRKSGVEVLRNDTTELTTPGGGKFCLGGLESAWGGTPDFNRMTRGIDRAIPLLLGWHEPDPFDEICADPRLALQVSGHTHGGQVCAPFFGALKLPKHGKKYVAGLYANENSRLYVSRGIGAMGVPVRFCCPPEISLITLKSDLG